MLFAFFDLIHELGDVGRGGYTISRGAAVRRAAAAVAHVRALSRRGADRHAVRHGAARRQLRVHGDARVGRVAAAGRMVGDARRHPAGDRRRSSPASSSRRRPSASRRRCARRPWATRRGVVAQQFKSGFWFKQDQTFVNIRSVLADMTLVGVRIYEFDRDLRLRNVRTRRIGHVRRQRPVAARRTCKTTEIGADAAQA